jgi:DNA-binding PadR family transcriptional regulator
MSTTRLLMLGAVRIFQPAHGYLVRRELASWEVDQWAHLNPGSIYNALRTLTRDGFLTEEQTDRAIGGFGSAAKAAYRLTAVGEEEFFRLLRAGLWQVDPSDPARLLAALSFCPALPRAEVLDALETRRAQLQARLSGLRHQEAEVLQNPLKPDHVTEHFRLIGHVIGAELAWLAEFGDRVRGGAYAFAGESGLETFIQVVNQT